MGNSYSASPWPGPSIAITASPRRSMYSAVACSSSLTESSPGIMIPPGAGAPGGDPQVRGQRAPGVRHPDRLGGRAERARAAAEAGHRAVVRGPLLLRVVGEDELAPVPAQRGPPPRLPCGDRPPGRLGGLGQLLV